MSGLNSMGSKAVKAHIEKGTLLLVHLIMGALLRLIRYLWVVPVLKQQSTHEGQSPNKDVQVFISIEMKKIRTFNTFGQFKKLR